VIYSVCVVIRRSCLKFVVHSQTVELRCFLVLYCHFDLEEFSLVPIGPVVWSKRILKQVQVVLELSRETNVELGHDLEHKKSWFTSSSDCIF